jgi:exodeoxyribonuclease V alpha subunit
MKITGKIERILFNSGDYHVCLIKTPNKSQTTVINQPDIKIGFFGDFYGELVNHQKFGTQFKCDYFIETLPETKEGFINYILSNKFTGIGSVTAKRIADHLGDDPLGKLKEDIDVILTVPKVKKAQLELIKKKWSENSVKSEVIILLQQYGIIGASLDKIYNQFGNASLNEIKKNPYNLINFIVGIGFIQADRIALSFGVAPDSKLRILECVKFVLKSSSLDGSCYLTENQIFAKTIEIIPGLTKEQISSILDDPSINKLIINDEVRYYSKNNYISEQGVLLHLKKMIQKNNKFRVPKIDSNNNLTDQQLSAVKGCLTNKISILTGGPGCGKTYTTKTIIDTLIKMNKSFMVCAPTGKAAMRSSEVIGIKALTIHRLLSFNFKTNSFDFNEKNPLKTDYLIVEESSMIDINLMYCILKAIGLKTQVLFVGDHNQLPPIGAGAPFKDIINSGMIPIFHLNKIFRQAMSSKIITYAHGINNGEKVSIESPIINKTLWSSNTDCMFIDSNINTLPPHPNYSTLRYGYDIIETIKKLYTETIKKHKNIGDIQILIPRKNGTVGVNAINVAIQDIVNPITDYRDQILINFKSYRLNDKVIHTKNTYDLGGGVFNGEIGRIIKINTEKSTCVVSYGDDRNIEYTKKDMLNLDLAFAITIHKSQGSEFECVILPLLNSYSIMLERSLIYTGLTRAKKLAIFVGQRESLYRSIATVNMKKRQTSLTELLTMDNNVLLNVTKN